MTPVFKTMHKGLCLHEPRRHLEIEAVLNYQQSTVVLTLGLLGLAISSSVESEINKFSKLGFLKVLRFCQLFSYNYFRK